MISPTGRLLGVALSIAILAGLPSGAAAQSASECAGADAGTPEDFGPTDVSATSGNQALSVAVNPDATVTVLKWPSPSFYDQIKYQATDRRRRFMGAAPNEGALIGLAYKSRGGWDFSWLRAWRADQRYADDDSDEIETTFRRRPLGLTVVVSDLVARDADVLARGVEVRRDRDSKITKVGVVGFGNFNPVFSKTEQAPYQDWCNESTNDAGGNYAAGADAITQARTGTDASSDRESGAALAMGFDGSSDGHAVGEDTYETGVEGRSAYDDASDGKLSGADSASGQVDAALIDTMSVRGGRATTTLFIAAGKTRGEALAALRSARQTGYDRLRRDKAAWWRTWLSEARLPRNAPRVVTNVAKRSLIVLRQGFDATITDHNDEGHALGPGGTTVASIATQPPYGLDWIRDGAYINQALDLAGHPEMVDTHNFRYGLLQAETGDTPRGGQPNRPGNWSQNFYADGVVGGPIPYEIDETGFGMWTLWEHFRLTQDANYLLSELIYEAIQRAAIDMTDVCIDPASGLPCAAPEDDSPTPTQGLRGAMLVWRGLDSAVKAAQIRGGEAATANAERWGARRDQIRRAIDDRFFDADCTCYTREARDGGTLMWPVHLLDYDGTRGEAQAQIVWNGIARAISGKLVTGGGEPEAIVGNAYAWAGVKSHEKQMKRALQWLATAPAIDDTGLLGDAWMHYPNERSPIVTMLGQPHLPSHAMFYLAALKVYGAAPYRF